MNERSYTADLIPDHANDDRAIAFDVYRTGNDAEPWGVSSDIGHTTHATLDEALFWELIMGGRHISETMRRQIHIDFGEPFPD